MSTCSTHDVFAEKDSLTHSRLKVGCEVVVSTWDRPYPDTRRSPSRDLPVRGESVIPVLWEEVPAPPWNPNSLRLTPLGLLLWHGRIRTAEVSRLSPVLPNHGVCTSGGLPPHTTPPDPLSLVKGKILRLGRSSPTGYRGDG